MDDRYALLTGVVRSGTTLACELLNRLPETVALDEPMDLSPMVEEIARDKDLAPDRALICNRIQGFLDDMRSSILNKGNALSEHVAGRITSRKFADDYSEGRPRKAVATRGTVRIEKSLSPGFVLVAKHPSAFTVLLDPLSRRFRVYATVRNPLAVLGSWQTAPLAVRNGRATRLTERLEPELARELSRIEDRIDRQIRLLGWFFSSYDTFLPRERIIRYEALVESGGRALSVITDRASVLDENLENRNSAALCPRELMRVLAERLLDSDGPYWDFYTRESVAELAGDR